MSDTINIASQPAGPINVTAMTVLSLCIPGLGQLCTAQVGKGLAMLALGLVLFFIWPPLVLVIDCYSAWDAYDSSKRINSQKEQEVEVVAKIAEESITATAMVSQIEKLNNLAKANMLTATELAERKAGVISLLETKTPVGSVEDFLTTLIPLSQSGGLTADEIGKIKSLLMR